MVEQTINSQSAGTETPNNGAGNSRQYDKPIGPAKSDRMAQPNEGVYSKGSHTVDQPFKTPEKREKIVKDGESAKLSFNSLSETFKRGQDGKVLHKEFEAQTEALQKLHVDRKAAVEAKVDADALKVIDKNIEDATKALEPKKEAFGKLKISQRTAASVGGNLGKNVGTLEKGIRGTGAVVGLGAMISGTKQLISPEVDENGERKGGVGKQLGKIAGGAAVVYASLVAGGANRALGMAKA